MAFCYSFGQQRMYVGLHYVTVKNEDAEAHINSERDYFSKMHKASIDSGNKIGWDMWRLENPNYREPHTTFVYAHLENPDNIFSNQVVIACFLKLKLKWFAKNGQKG